MRSKIHFLMLALLLCCVPLRAQWSGNVDLSAGLGGMSGSIITDDKPMIHGLTEGKFQLNYKKEKFSWITTVDGKWEPKTTDNSRMAYKNEKLNITYKAAHTQPLSTSIKSEFTWTPNSHRNYSTWILYQYKNDRAQNHSMTFDGSVEDMENMSYYYEIPTMNEHKLETGLKTFRSFSSGRSILRSSLKLQAIGNNKVNTWIVFKTGDPSGSGTIVNIDDVTGYAWKYRITPQSYDFNLDGDINLQRTVRDDDIKLKVTPGARLAIKHALDENSGATRINVSWEEEEEIWKDSTRLRESFNYLSVCADPYIIVDFHWKNLEAKADYAAQVYGRRLNNETHQQPLN
ncbi:MAG: hypothetical protein II406_07345, partial [Bacteroidales bacterium]|nr:hypothetical protein [Bacteroidales bacterium]